MEVTLLTQADCTWCEHAKQILERLRAEFPLTVTTVELHSPAGQALAEQGGILFPPGLFVDGAAISYGRVSERRLRRLLHRRLHATKGACP